MFISDFAIKRPLVTVGAMVALVVFGLVALFKLKTDEFPEVSPQFLTVGIVYPGASPEVVESEVLKPVEEQIGSISGVKRIIGKAYDGYQMVMIEFIFGKDMNVASQEVRDATTETVEVRGGIQPGDTILLGAARGISEKTPVKVSAPSDTGRKG